MMARRDFFFGLLLVFCLAAPFFAGRAMLQLGAEFAITLTLALLWNLLAGFAGIVSIGQQAFVGFGGYLLFALVALAGWPVLVALLAACLASALLGGVAAPLLFRLRGAQFAIGSWVFAEILRLAFAQVSALGGGSGMSLPVHAVLAISPDRLTRLTVFYAMPAALAAAVYTGSWALLRSRIGLGLRALRDSETAAASLGVNVVTLRYRVYVGVAAATGLAGALMFLDIVRISPDAGFSVNDWTADVIFIVVIGGVGRLEGPLLGSLAFFGLRAAFSGFSAWYLIGLGLFAIVMMLAGGSGLSGLVAWALQEAGTRWQSIPGRRPGMGISGKSRAPILAMGPTEPAPGTPEFLSTSPNTPDKPRPHPQV
jgi:branched-chain amino acid transport system permease protein